MSDNDPFAEPNDTERTVIKPNPTGRRSAAQPMQPAEPPDWRGPPEAQATHGVPTATAPAAPDAAVGQAATGMNSLNACASTLFSLISRIRNRAQHMDPDALRRNVVAEVRAFESRALQAGDPQTVKVARYVLCATIDDVVLNTPWGGQSAWTQQSLVGTFHKEVVGGDRFFDVLARLEQEPAKNIDLLEFIYVCLSLGFEGRLRVEPGGQDKHLQIRNGLARIIRAQRGPVERDLSPHWKGVDRAHKPLSAWLAIWVTLGAFAAVLGLGYFALTWALGGSTGRLVGQLSALDAGVVAELQRRAPPPPPPAELPGQDQVNALAQFLAPEIEQKLVTVLEDANTVTVRIVGEGMFGSGSDSLQPAFVDPLNRVAAALNEQPGPVIVAGHSDNVPIKTARFPSNMHLSLARAESVMRQLAAGLEDPSRLSAEGRADKEPIASNATAEGQARNRRIEIILVKVAPK